VLALREKLGFQAHISERLYPAIDSVQHCSQELRALNRDDRTDIHACVRLSINIDQGKQP
jgi:hypothetical protein